MKLVVGLGNVGKDYDNTRHNVGFMALDNYLGNVSWKKDKLAYTYKDSVSNTLFIKPTTFMNLSGESVRAVVDYYKIPIENILIIYDDLSLELGKIRFRKSSSHGGHNGIKSVLKHLGTNDIEYESTKAPHSLVNNYRRSFVYILLDFLLIKSKKQP